MTDPFKPDPDRTFETATIPKDAGAGVRKDALAFELKRSIPLTILAYLALGAGVLAAFEASPGGSMIVLRTEWGVYQGGFCGFCLVLCGWLAYLARPKVVVR